MLLKAVGLAFSLAGTEGRDFLLYWALAQVLALRKPALQ
jgi:hypothetical protein